MIKRVVHCRVPSAYKIERDVVLKKGEVAEVGSYQLKLDDIEEFTSKDYGGLRAVLSLTKQSNEFVTKLKPEKRVYGKKQEVTTEVDIYSSLKEDVYVALSGLDVSSRENPTVVFKVFINPLQIWLWISGVFMILGSLLLILDSFGIFLKGRAV